MNYIDIFKIKIHKQKAYLSVFAFKKEKISKEDIDEEKFIPEL